MKDFADMTPEEQEDLCEAVAHAVTEQLPGDLDFILILGNNGTGNTVVLDSIGDDDFLAKVFGELAKTMNRGNN